MIGAVSKRILITSGMAALVCLSPISARLTPAAFAAGSKESEREANRSVELNAIVFPVIIDGRLVNYLFINARLIVADGKDTWKFREKKHIIRDALLRATHRKSVHLEGYPGRLDQALAEKLCVEAANDVVGEEAFIGMSFQQVASQKPF